MHVPKHRLREGGVARYNAMLLAVVILDVNVAAVRSKGDQRHVGIGKEGADKVVMIMEMSHQRTALVFPLIFIPLWEQPHLPRQAHRLEEKIFRQFVDVVRWEAVVFFPVVRIVVYLHRVRA